MKLRYNEWTIAMFLTLLIFAVWFVWFAKANVRTHQNPRPHVLVITKVNSSTIKTIGWMTLKSPAVAVDCPDIVGALGHSVGVWEVAFGPNPDSSDMRNAYVSDSIDVGGWGIGDEVFVVSITAKGWSTCDHAYFVVGHRRK